MNNRLLSLLLLAAALPAAAVENDASRVFLSDAAALKQKASDMLPSLTDNERREAAGHVRTMASLQQELAACSGSACAAVASRLAREARAAFGPQAPDFDPALRRLQAEAGDFAAAASPARAPEAAGSLRSLDTVSAALDRGPGDSADTLAAFYENGNQDQGGSVAVPAGDPAKAPARVSAAPAPTGKRLPPPGLHELTQVAQDPRNVFDQVMDAEIPTPSSIAQEVAAAAVAPEADEPAASPATAKAQAKASSTVHWDAQIFTGDSVDAPTPLSIHQNGQPDINVGAAQYYTSPWSQYAPYYAWRIGRWDGDDAWEFEHIHNKMFLANLPPGVQQFQLTHGYNYVLINRAHKAWGFIWRVGAGAIVTHPEIIVRGQSLSQDSGGIGGGYFLCGVGAQGAVEKRLYLSDHVYGSLEAAVTAGYADVPIVNGDAQVPALTLHGLFGVGAEF